MKSTKTKKAAPEREKPESGTWKTRCLAAEEKLAALQRGKDIVEIDLSRVLENSLAGELYQRISYLEGELAMAKQDAVSWRTRFDGIAVELEAGTKKLAELEKACATRGSVIDILAADLKRLRNELKLRDEALAKPTAPAETDSASSAQECKSREYEARQHMADAIEHVKTAMTCLGMPG